jgi:hypothetical protein
MSVDPTILSVCPLKSIEKAADRGVYWVFSAVWFYSGTRVDVSRKHVPQVAFSSRNSHIENF